MKILLDQNLSPRLCAALSSQYEAVIHVKDMGLEASSDAVIWNYAAAHGFAIVTKDSDLHQRSFLEGHPPKIIWIRLGNCSTSAIAELLESRHQVILGFFAEPYKSFLALS